MQFVVRSHGEALYLQVMPTVVAHLEVRDAAPQYGWIYFDPAEGPIFVIEVKNLFGNIWGILTHGTSCTAQCLDGRPKGGFQRPTQVPWSLCLSLSCLRDR